MRKLIVGLLVMACAGLAEAQFNINDTVGVAGSDPAGPKAGAVQGITGGKPVPVSGSVSLSDPVTAVTTGGDEIANEATLEAIRVLAVSIDALAAQIDWRGNTGPGHADEIETVLKSNGPSSQANQGSSAEGSPPSGFPFAASGVDESGDQRHIAVKTTGEVEVISELDGSEWSEIKNFTGVASQTDVLVKACPAGKRLVITGVFASNGGTVKINLQDEDDVAALNTIYQNGSGSGAVVPGTKDSPWKIMGTDKDLEVDSIITGTVDYGFTVKGYIID